MADWKNLDELTAYKELEKVSPVDLKTVMAGESGADRVKNCSIPMAEGLSYNYAAKAVDNRITEQLEKGQMILEPYGSGKAYKQRPAGGSAAEPGAKIEIWFR